MSSGAIERLALKVGEEFSVSLNENRTTGHAWRLETPGAILETVREERERSPRLMGAGGVVTFRFRAKAPGKGRLVALYERPWEREPVRRRMWDVVVEA